MKDEPEHQKEFKVELKPFVLTMEGVNPTSRVLLLVLLIFILTQYLSLFIFKIVMGNLNMHQSRQNSIINLYLPFTSFNKDQFMANFTSPRSIIFSPSHIVFKKTLEIIRPQL